MHMVDINCVRNNKWRTHHVIQVNDRFEFKKIYAVRIQFTLKKKQTNTSGSAARRDCYNQTELFRNKCLRKAVKLMRIMLL